MPWLTTILKMPVVDQAGKTIGRVSEVMATRANYPKVSEFGVSTRRIGSSTRSDGFLHWDGIEVQSKKIVAKSALDVIAPNDVIGLRADLLDRQIVDTDGARVVRINDLLLSESAGGLRVVGVDVGLRGVLRQLGLEGLVSGLAEALGYEIKEKLIAWNYVAALEESSREVRLTVPTRLLKELHPSELADLLDQLDADRRERIIRVMTITSLAETLAETDPEVSVAALDLLGHERAKRVIELMPPDEATDLLGALGYEKSEKLLGLMGVKQASVLRELLGYPPDTAGGRMTPSFVGIQATATVQEAIDQIRAAAGEAETIYYTYVLGPEGDIEGVLSLRDLLRASPNRPIIQIMESDVVSVFLETDQQEVARNFAKYNLLAMPVTDERGKIRGIVTVDDVIDVLEEEHSENIGQVTGVYVGEGTETTPGRLAGFGLSLLAGMAAAFLLQAQRPAMASIAAVAWLLPLYLRMAQDLGTWSLARALVANTLQPRGRLDALTHELFAGLFSAAFSGILVGAIGALWTRSLAVAGFFGVGIFVGSLAASLIGLGLPSLAKAAGMDWLLKRGRLLAVIVGLSSLLVYAWALNSLAARL